MRCAIFFVAFLLVAAFPVFSQSAKHVILISIDGLRPEFYKDKSWSAPNLQRMMEEGVYADGVNSVFPSITYPSHTTLVTGALPARHGIYFNAPKDSTKGQWYWEESYIRTHTLWDAAKDAGLTSGAVMWPVTVGAPIDYNFPVRRPNKNENKDQLEVTRPLVTPPGLLDEIQKAGNRTLDRSDLSHDNIDKTIAVIANHILHTRKPNLMAIHFLSLDHAGHAVGREGKQIREALVLVDSLVGSVLAIVEKAGIKNNTAIIVTGDHGMVTKTTGFSPNLWLKKSGLLAKARFHPSGGAAFLYLKDRNDKATLSKVQRILDGASTSEKKMFTVLNREKLDEAGADPEAMLALAFAKGVTFENALKGEVVRHGLKGGGHGHYPDFEEIQTGFIAFGAGVNKGVRIPQMGIVDVAIIVSRLLGMDFISPDGVLHTEILKD